jgi:hypothetical protein
MATKAGWRARKEKVRTFWSTRSFTGPNFLKLREQHFVECRATLVSNDNRSM